MVEGIVLDVLKSVASNLITQALGAIFLAWIARPVFRWIPSELLSIRRALKKDRQELIEKMIGGGIFQRKHDFILEDTFRDLFKVNPEASVIRYLLSQEHPTKKIKQFVRGFLFIKNEKDSNGKTTNLRLNKNLDKKSRYRLRILIGNSLYGIFFFLAMAPILFFGDNILGVVDRKGFPILIGVAGWFIGFMIGAVTSLKDSSDLYFAKQLVESVKPVQPDPA
ncbi:hypothetical protein [Thalassospira lucentensis]|uniref:hypothetical protein n=1 Tax=Thalassospira lucentensis TaxID=168935 RepID=UPI003D2A2DD1